MNVNLFYSTAWYSQTDNIFESFNQTAKIILRYYIVILDDVKNWLKIFHHITISLNNSTKYNFIALTLIKIFYNFCTRETFNLLKLKDLNTDISQISDRFKETFSFIIIIINSIIIKNVNKLESTSSITLIAKNFRFLITFNAFASSIAKNFNKIIEILRRFAIMIKYRPYYIDVKNAIVFALLRIKNYYDIQY